MLDSQQLVEPDLTGIFDASPGSSWEHASIEDCKRGKLFPNMLAYHEISATLALIVKHSTTGTDFALSQAGLNYLLTALEKGAARKDGKPVRHALVILADYDAQPKNHHFALKVVSCSTAHQIRDRLDGRPPNPGNLNGPYWWISPEGDSVWFE
jgi:hypothetical protein